MFKILFPKKITNEFPVFYLGSLNPIHMQQDNVEQEVLLSEPENTEIVQTLRTNIIDAVALIESREKTPEDTRIGRMMKQLQALDLEVWREMVGLYKPVSDKYFREIRKTDKRYQEELRKAEYHVMTLSTRGSSGDTAGYDSQPTKYQQRELGRATPDRTKKPLPDKAKKTKVQKFAAVPQQTFEFNGETYGKGPLVLAVVLHHAKKNPKISHEQMKAAFPDTLLRGYGIFTTRIKAEDLCKTRKRYFVREDQFVKLTDEQIAVCNQFTSDNIGAFLNQCKLLGYTIK
jgi:hypothetical protein